MEKVDPETLKMLTSLHPVGHLGTPEEVAELVFWLSTQRVSFIAGTYFLVDGGYLVR